MHVRINERESNPNAFVNFITPLPGADDEEDARQYLRALAAQVRPVMQQHGFGVNSLEEYEFNKTFWGRNWNHGETVELVLRGPSGRFLPTSFLMGVFCHELAHIKHMNHGPAFQALWKQLRHEVRVLQDKGYYGDGFWSSGARLIDSADMSGDGIAAEDMPEFFCGGAQSQSRPTRRKRRVRKTKPGEPIASNKTGRQTEKRRKAGGRVTAKDAFVGEGSTLGAAKGPGTGFGKQAGSKRAREERAAAAEKRLKMLSGAQPPPPPKEEEDASSDDEVEIVAETDADRRKLLPTEDNNGARSWRDFADDFIFRAPPENEHENDMPIASGSTFVMPTPKPKPAEKGKAKAPAKSNIAQTEMAFRKKEVLGLAPVKESSRVLGGRPPPPARNEAAADPEWTCKFCTLINKGTFLACDASFGFIPIGGHARRLNINDILRLELLVLCSSALLNIQARARRLLTVEVALCGCPASEWQCTMLDLNDLESVVVDAATVYEEASFRTYKPYGRSLTVSHLGQTYFVKYNHSGRFWSQIHTQQYLSEYAEAQSECGKLGPLGPRIPKVFHAFEKCTERMGRMAYMITEHIEMIHPSLDDAVVREGIKYAVCWLASAPIPEGHVLGPLGGRMRHSFFRDCIAPFQFPSLDALERYVNRGRMLFRGKKRACSFPYISLADETTLFLQTDMHAGNFGIDAQGHIVLLDFDSIGVVPQSFALYTLHTRFPDIARALDLPERLQEGVWWLSQIAGRIHMGDPCLGFTKDEI
ncbi:hypothetical protein MKEN_00360400 [Mycena kentingensis (nom. inval.)]|nr:hypothetical protein MKEN_00360400 [Mycena kentingensis (nom. inval.)]